MSYVRIGLRTDHVCEQNNTSLTFYYIMQKNYLQYLQN